MIWRPSIDWQAPRRLEGWRAVEHCLALLAVASTLGMPVVLASAPAPGLVPICAGGEIRFVDMGLGTPGTEPGTAEWSAPCPLVVVAAALLSAGVPFAAPTGVPGMQTAPQGASTAPILGSRAAYSVRAPPFG